jgi:hypothetical protein
VTFDPIKAAKVHAIVAAFFPDGATHLVVGEQHASVPVIAARVLASTRSFTVGQKVLVYDGYWGQAERVKVVARYRRKHRWIRGVCPIAKLGEARPVVEHDPAVVRALRGAWISLGMFLPYLTGTAAL